MLQGRDRKPRVVPCRNCGKDASYTYQGMQICADCYKIVTSALKKARTELEMVFTLYVDSLRVAIVKGELRPPRLPPPGQMPTSALVASIRDIQENLNVGRDSGVHPLRVEPPESGK